MTGRVARAVQKVSATRGFARVAPYVVPAVDRGVHRLTRGRVMLSGLLLPSVVLSVRGARSGVVRRTPLACVPEWSSSTGVPSPESWLLVGSNFGRESHPAWTVNLRAHPDAVINWRGVDVPVAARLLRGEERAAAWGVLVAFWPPYAVYQGRVGRELRVFRVVRRGVDQG
ncbi:nitroreductase/quinone reductase family protein [Streptomyces sp. NPDC048290]|uniref:nitroreductase/quinone reductase family protein n=1 Tax=Streptomyces sp. NPDC048290 TaxID=3155811 RepID=UPI00342D6219